MTEIAQIVRKAVERQGVIPFAEFMRLALYCPKYGYYEQAESRIGRAGHFLTSVSIGSLFGELLAFQAAEWLENLPGGRLQLVEAGAHDGQLAADVLNWFSRAQPALLKSMEYWIIEPSACRQAWQKSKLENFADRVRWFQSLAALPRAGVNGIIFSNELLDAMPVRRIGWDASSARWFEWGVTINGSRQGHFVWEKIPREAGFLAAELVQSGLELPSEMLAALPDGFTLEVCPEAATWWKEAASALKEGKLLTIDYGLESEQFITAERAGGTLRAYYRHHSSADVLGNVGEQDLTAHVNFTQLQRAGEATGLLTEGLFSQERFLTNVAARAWQKEASLGARTPEQVRQFQTLTHPEHLGRSFSVFLQARGA